MCIRDRDNPVLMRVKSSFTPESVNGTEIIGIEIDMVANNATCDVPNPPAHCSLFPGGAKGLQEFNPLTIVMGGGDISFRMKRTGSNITVHYVHVDMLASGPPDAVFEDSATNASGGNTVAEAWKFGSTGPEIYDSILIGIPYNPSNYNEAGSFYARIEVFYDEHWNVIWNKTAGNTTAQLASIGYSEFATGTYDDYITTTGMLCSKSVATSTCYVNTTSNMVWMKIPHFSGVGPKIVQTVSSGSQNGTDDDGTTDGTTGGPTGGDDNTTGETNTTITDIGIINSVLAGITAEDIGMTGTLTADDVDVIQIGSQKTATAAVTSDLLTSAEAAATTDEAKAAIDALKAALADGRNLQVTAKLDVYQVTSKTTGQAVYVSKVTLTFTADSDMEDVVIVEVIPKDVAADIADVVFHGEQPAILQSDPIVQWELGNVSSGQTKDLSYTVKKKLNTISSTTLAMAGRIIEQQPATPGPGDGDETGTPAGPDYTLIIVIIAIAAVIVAAVVYMYKKEILIFEKKGSIYSYKPPS